VLSWDNEVCVVSRQ